MVDKLKARGERAAASSAQCIELFERTLDFCLRLLKHESLLVATIYRRSAETRLDLTSQLTLLIIASIMSEFERFFRHECDFGKVGSVTHTVKFTDTQKTWH